MTLARMDGGRRGGVPGRRGFTYLEIVLASVVFAVTLAGLAATMMAQEKLMRAMESRVFVLLPYGRELRVTSDEVDGRRLYAAVVGDPVYPAEGARPSVLSRVPRWLGQLGNAPPATFVTFDGRVSRMPESGLRMRPPSYTRVDAAVIDVSPALDRLRVETTKKAEDYVIATAELTD